MNVTIQPNSLTSDKSRGRVGKLLTSNGNLDADVDENEEGEGMDGLLGHDLPELPSFVGDWDIFNFLTSFLQAVWHEVGKGSLRFSRGRLRRNALT